MKKESKVALGGICALTVLYTLTVFTDIKPDKEKTLSDAKPYFTEETTEIEPDRSSVISKVPTKVEAGADEENSEPINEVWTAKNVGESEPVTNNIDGVVKTAEAISGEVSVVAGSVDKIEEKETPTQTEPEPEETYKYVALGNSVTCNDVSDLWWSTCGMAATSPNKDYAHIVKDWLASGTTQPMEFYEVSIKDWELATDRGTELCDLDAILTEDTDVITIQTGENITEGLDTLPTDYFELLSHIHQKCPNAKVVVLGELLWPMDEIEEAKKNACMKTGIPFVGVESFLNGYDALYRSSIGTLVLGDDGNEHSIDNEVVAAHPNDEGMAHIAQIVIEALK